ncbi:MAG TPA: SapC family protein [Steroidobacteraceae bacterium]|nr:SapC family protein [Steroidobacteraceae bacterium]
MTRIVPLNKETHKELKVDARASAAYGDNQRFTHVIVNEFPQLVVHYPILFSKDGNTGEFFCGVMLGFDEGENLFLEEWRDLQFYRPLGLQRVPFYAQGPEVAIDLDHPRVGVEGGTALFTEHGQPSRYLQRIIWAFQDLAPGIEVTKHFIKRLLELNLIEPVDLEAEFDDGRIINCDGLYTVNQDTLMRLPDEAVVELFRRGYMRLIHYMIGSLKQFAVLARKKNGRILKATEGLAGLRPSALG